MRRKDMLKKLGIKESTYATCLRYMAVEHPPIKKEFGKAPQYLPDDAWFEETKKAVIDFQNRPQSRQKKGSMIDGNSWIEMTEEYMKDIGEKR